MTEVMGEMLQFMKHCLPAMIVFIVLALVAMKLNMKKQFRNRQLLMPIVGLAYAIVAAVLMVKGSELVLALMHKFLNLTRTLGINPGVIENFFSNLADTASNGLLAKIASFVANLIARIIHFIRNVDVRILLYFIENIGFLALFMLVKGILIKIMKKAFSREGSFIETLGKPLYEKYEGDAAFYLKKNCVQTRAFMKAVNLTVIIGLSLLALVSCGLYHGDFLAVPFSPVIAVILVGEVAYILGGQTKQESGSLEGEDEQARHHVRYFLMKDVLRELFGDKLSSESTTINSGLVNFRTNQEVIAELEDDPSQAVETYGRFLAHKQSGGMELDHKYVMAGKDLILGKSVLFNDPFYNDLIPYLFYPMNRQLLNHKKILVVLGRHGTEDEMERWCRDGLVSVNNTPTLWRIGVIGSDEKELDVGILSRSKVQDLALHEANGEFLENLGMMVLVEPSRLLATAQIGINSLVRYSSINGKKPVFVSIDKNCDGLVDALSHVLMASLTEVSATEHHSGISSYMCWDANSDHLQHRMLPNLSRFLGFGTELSVAALKNQISETWWYGGDAYPVVDARWIAGQYYFDLLDYASLPTAQDTLDAKFIVTPGMWGAKKTPYQYMTVEDEDNNLFEVKRNFATRAAKEGFVNVLSPSYLMKDYMTENDSIFAADPKAIPCVVADYAHTARNVVLRLCLRMSVGFIWESELVGELTLIDASTVDPVASLWREICGIHRFGDEPESEILVCNDGDRRYEFTREVIRVGRKYNYRLGKMEYCFSIIDKNFIHLYVDVLKNIEYVAEDEMGENQYLGGEILGQIYQLHLPGQFFTIAGKYYELLRVNGAGKVMLRRAADHITGRKSYRQVREYRLDNIRVSERMGDVRETDGLQVSVCMADIGVATPAYWDMDRYNDFETAHRVAINGIPERRYCNKKILKLGFEGGKTAVTPEICRTLAVLINELFVTLFAGNQGFIAAVTPGEQDIPITYTLKDHPEENCIYIIEDSQLDIGLIEAAQRNLGRIFAIICDYLDWEGEAVENSINPPPAPAPEKVELPEPSDEAPEGSKKKRRGPFRRLVEWLKKIFKRKKKKKDEPVAEETEEPEALMSMSYGRARVLMDTAVSEDGTDASVEFEPDEAQVVEGTEVSQGGIPTRKPYHERRYLLYGGMNVPQGLVLKETLDFLKDRGYGNSELKQAREGKKYADAAENGFVPNQEGRHYCDFCGEMLTGTEYEVLKDGRERCMNCGRTAIKTEKEFVDLYKEVKETLERCYCIKINAPVTVKMVNAKRLHRALGQTFVPTGNSDGRVLGVAISSREGYSLLVENGSPRISSAMTMAHEMTHIWQYLNWDKKAILKKYGRNNELLVYEGMAMWSEIQYAYLMGENAAAKREELTTRQRDDEYGKGFAIYESRYPISEGMSLEGDTPFMNNPPL